MKKHLLLIITSVYFFNIQAQHIEHYGFQFAENFAFNTNGLDLFTDYNKKGKSIGGDTYLFKEVVQGNIKLFSKQQLISGFNVRYNIYANSLEIEKGDSVFVVPGSQVQFFRLRINDKTISFINSSIIKNNKLPQCFLEVLTYGEIILLKLYETSLQEPMGHHYGASVQTKKYVKKEKYYVVMNDDFFQIRLKEKSILEILEDKRSEVVNYSKDNKLSVKREEDLVKIFNYYNQLHNTMSNN